MYHVEVFVEPPLARRTTFHFSDHFDVGVRTVRERRQQRGDRGTHDGGPFAPIATIGGDARTMMMKDLVEVRRHCEIVVVPDAHSLTTNLSLCHDQSRGFADG